MNLITSRRSMLQAALGVLASGGLLRNAPAQSVHDKSTQTNRLGMFISLGADPDKALKQVADLGLTVAEVYSEDLDAEMGKKLEDAKAKHQIDISALFTMGPGPQGWNHKDGPPTNGLVPRQWRRQRVDRLKEASDFCKQHGIPAVETHIGFVPEDPNDPLYGETVVALREAAEHCKQNGQRLLYHAGGETAVTMLRTLIDVGVDSQGIGLDTANPIMYGTGHPADVLEVYGQYLVQVNAKDALWPTGPIELGKEVPIGEGKVDFPRVFKKLRELKYAGPIIIEREISGPQQIADIKKAIGFLKELLSK